MFYTDYETRIVLTHKVHLVGWPFRNKLCSPYDIHTVADVRHLKEALRAGSCSWQPVKAHEMDALIEKLNNNGVTIRRSKKGAPVDDDEVGQEVVSASPASTATTAPEATQAATATTMAKKRGPTKNTSAKVKKSRVKDPKNSNTRKKTAVSLSMAAAKTTKASQARKVASQKATIAQAREKAKDKGRSMKRVCSSKKGGK